MPVSGVLAQQRQSNVQIWMMLMIVMAALLLLVWRFSSFIVAPIGRLTQIAREYAAGNYQNRMDLQRKDEIGILGESLSQMSEQLIDANRALMEQNQRQTAIFEAMNNGLVAVDTQLHVVLTNPAARQMLGIGWNAKGQSLFVATGQPELEGFFTRTLKQENEPVEEFVFTRVRTHERRTMRVRGSRFLLADGSVGGAVALIEDVTEQMCIRDRLWAVRRRGKDAKAGGRPDGHLAIVYFAVGKAHHQAAAKGHGAHGVTARLRASLRPPRAMRAGRAPLWHGRAV